jgi:UDP-3-O-acyl-N-acetylglucosamine deacetylase
VLISALFFKMIDISNISNNQQQTIGKPVSIRGIGLHTGAEVTMNLYPAKADYGIKFIRKDIKNNNVIEALWSNVSSTKLSTTISNQNRTSVSTIEHLMSALSGLHIDNIKIEIDGPEVPIMDGSSIKFVDLIDQTSIQSLNKRRKILKVKKNIKVENNDSSVE